MANFNSKDGGGVDFYHACDEAGTEGDPARLYRKSLDAGPAWTSSLGANNAPVSSADMTTAAVVTDSPSVGLKLVVTDVVISTDTAMRFDLLENNSSLRHRVYLAAGVPHIFRPRGKWKLSAAQVALWGQASVAGHVSVTVLWYAEA